MSTEIEFVNGVHYGKEAAFGRSASLDSAWALEVLPAPRGQDPESEAPGVAIFGPPERRTAQFAGEQDARHENRPALALPVVVCGIGLDSKLFFELTRTLDVSRSGCRLHLRTRPQMNSTLAVRLIRRGEAEPEESVQILCRVAWLRSEAGGWTIGASCLGERII